MGGTNCKDSNFYETQQLCPIIVIFAGMNLKKTYIVLALAFASLTGYSQDYPERQAFQDSSGKVSTLFRQKQAVRYNFPHNGNFYWQSPEFKTGEVLFGGKLYKNLLLNIDAVRHQPVVMPDRNSVVLDLDREYVLYFTMGKARLDNLFLQGVKGAGEGFYELLEDADYKLYRRVGKTLAESTDFSVNGDGIGYEDPAYRRDVHRYFRYHADFYALTPEGELVPLRNKGSVRKLLGVKKSNLPSGASPEEYFRAAFKIRKAGR